MAYEIQTERWSAIDFSGNELVMVFQIEIRPPKMDRKKPLKMIRDTEKILRAIKVEGRPNERGHRTEHPNEFEIVEIGKTRGSGYVVELKNRID